MGRRASASYYANTGMELFARNVGLPFAFYDVADPDAMLRALDQARSQPARLPGWGIPEGIEARIAGV